MSPQTGRKRQEWDDDLAMRIIADNKDRPGALLPILNGFLDHFGFVNPDSVPAIADALNLSRAEVHGVITFYHDYRTSPPGEHVIKICRAEACQSMQGHALIETVKKHLGIDFHETTTDGRYTLEPVYCLGNCACAPAMMVDDTLHGRLDIEKVKSILAEGRS